MARAIQAADVFSFFKRVMNFLERIAQAIQTANTFL